MSKQPASLQHLLGHGSSVCRVYSAYVKEIESKPSANEWGSKLPFAALLGEYSNGGGKNCVTVPTLMPSVAVLS